MYFLSLCVFIVSSASASSTVCGAGKHTSDGAGASSAATVVVPQ